MYMKYNTGMVQVYSTVATSLWWFMLTAAFFWKIWHPLNARSWQVTNKIKYIHCGCCLLGVFIPMIPVISLMVGFAIQINSSNDELSFLSGGLGFSLARFPPLPCFGTNRDIAFYSIIIPTDVLLTAGITLTILVFWIVHRVSHLFSNVTRVRKSIL